MPVQRILFVVAMLGFAGLMPALGQGAIHSDPAQALADRKDYIAKSGKTVPKPDKIDPNENSAIQRRTPDQLRDDAITRGICVGCSR